MGTYRQSRNIEASIIEFLVSELVSASFTNVNVEKAFAKVYELDLPTILVQSSDTIHNKVGIGSDSTWRNVSIFIDLYSTSDGNRLDLKDFLVSVLKSGCPYYEYTIANGAIQSKTQNGRLRVLNIADNIVNLGTDKNELDVHDRYRHQLILEISLGKVEN